VRFAFILPLAFEILTANVDLQFTEICSIFNRKLYYEISVRRHVARTVQRDCGTSTHYAWVLTTDGVVSSCRCRHCRCHVGQTDDEIVRSVSLTKTQAINMQMNLASWRGLLHSLRVISRSVPVSFKKSKAHLYCASSYRICWLSDAVVTESRRST